MGWSRAGILAAAGAVIVLAATGCGGNGAARDPDEAPAAAAVTVPLAEEAASGHTGTATLRDVSDGVSVVIELAPGDKYSEYPAHIHTGTCAEYRKLKTLSAQEKTVSDELQDVVDGRSDSTVYGATVADRTTGLYSVNVHAPVEAYKVVACGDIPRR